MSTADFIGIVGVICYQVAYAGLQLGRLQRDGKFYFYLNLFGPCCLLYSLVFHFNLAAAVSQLLWLMWSVVGVVVTARARRRQAVPTAGSGGDPDRSAALGSNSPM
ncbi:hypothetical protein LMG23992_02171 [Cupriavidus laharis]|uniref:CBU-0592-like domain-containing protein n=1 Tax=Cupriavidus laharis TaxID=151654 RepID=A0ABN7YFP3_9BURK|nr:hypothetical protein [Cupriavidus laharis]CAG9172258.1 hypothetical protein LMG23992_02171 [Cupriavidus laharis]